MRICVAQIRPFAGDVGHNIELHRRIIDGALSLTPDVIIFPELSLTGYEPTLAKELATTLDDSRFDVFQKISNEKKITIGAGMPIRSKEDGICICMILFRPGVRREVYSKKYIHADEEGYFISGENPKKPLLEKSAIALAICYELSIPEHTEDAFKNGAKIYIASVAKSIEGIDKALQRLSEIARTYSMIVLMSNCTGPADGAICAGKTSVWNTGGELLAQLDGEQEGLLMLDTTTQEVIKKIILKNEVPLV